MKGLKIFSIILILFLSNCAATYKFYTGNFPDKEIAFLNVDDNVYFNSINNTYISNDITTVKLLPGFYSVKVYSKFNSTEPPQSVKIKDTIYVVKNRDVSLGTPCIITFTAEAGKRYQIKANYLVDKWAAYVSCDGKSIENLNYTDDSKINKNFAYAKNQNTINVLIEPENPAAGDLIKIFYKPIILKTNSGIVIHWAMNNWKLLPEKCFPKYSQIDNDKSSVNTLMPYKIGWHCIEIQTTPEFESLNFVFSDGSNWDNNNGLDWKIIFKKK